MTERYVATFHTHLSALLTGRALTRLGVEARLAPVPRKLSASCGTCVFYAWDAPCLEQMDEDVEGVYRLEPDGRYLRLLHRE